MEKPTGEPPYDGEKIPPDEPMADEESDDEDDNSGNGLPNPEDIRQPRNDIEGPTYRSVSFLPPPWMQPSHGATDQLVKDVQNIDLNKNEPPPPTGWKKDDDKLVLATPSLFFPMEIVKSQHPMEELRLILNRCEKGFFEISAFVQYSDDPLSAKFMTWDGVEAQIKFWDAKEKGVVYVDIQNYRGDRLSYNHLLRYLIDVVKGNDVSESIKYVQPDYATSFDGDRIMRLQNAVGNLDDTEPADQGSIDGLLYSASLMGSKVSFERKMGLENLLGMTNMRQTIGATARWAAKVVLFGKGPATSDGSDHQEKYTLIHQTLIEILKQRQFQSDEDMIQDLKRVSTSNDGPFMKQPTIPNGEDLPWQYVDYLNDLYQIALKIAVNSLEVLSYFQVAVEDQVSQGCYDIFLKCIEKAEQQPWNASRACYGMFLLAKASVNLREKLSDHDYKVIEKANTFGKSCHRVLAEESQRLIDAIDSY